MKRGIWAALLASVSALGLAACSGGAIGGAETIGEARTRDAERAMLRQQSQLAPQDINAVRSVDGVFTGGLVRRNDRGEPLPRQWERADGFTARRSTPMQLFEISSMITETTKIPVSMAPDVTGGTQALAQAITTARTGMPDMQGGGDINAILGQLGLNSGAVPRSPGILPGGNLSGVVGDTIRPVLGTRNAMKVEYHGRLSGFLNAVSSHFGIGWEYSNQEIRFFRNQTRTFTINALPAAISLQTTQQADASAGGSGGGGSGGASNKGAANQTLSTEVSIKIWDEITAQVNNIVGGEGRVTSSVSTGTIAVTAPPNALARVQTYMERQNERLSRQVLVSVQVLQVDLNESDSYSLDMQGLFREAGRFGVSFGNLGGAAVPLANGALGSITGAPGMSFGVANPSSQWNRSGALAEALSTRGRVSVRQTASLMTMNGIPAPLQVANTRGYLASVSVSDSTTGGGSGSDTARTTLVPGQVTTGFSLSLLPRVREDGGSLMMQFAINISELVGPKDGFREFSSGGNSIQLPDVNTRSFVQQAEIPNGASLILTGFEQNRDVATRRGTVIPEFMGLGGSQLGNRGRTAIVIILTPQVVSQRAISVD